MKQPLSWDADHVTPLFILLVTIAVLMTRASDAWAYEAYSEGNDSGYCAACHGDFRSSPYTSPSGDSWSDDLHDVHRNGMLAGDCSTCHGSGPRFPVILDSSSGGNGLAAISCVGCHGRDEDIGNNTDRAAGLRQHHWNASVTLCADCHDDADPSFYTPVGEDVLPNYFANPGTGHPLIPTDSCNPNGEEGAFGGNLLGLDNDGDSVYDTGDSDCAPIGCQSNAECDDAAFCNGAETCNVSSGQCEPGSPVNVDDGVSCTDDSCDEANDVVVNTANDGLCDNGGFCDGSETCDAVNDCQAGTPVDVNDGVGCTDDSCDEANDVVVNVPNDAQCDNGAFCDGSETCDAVNDCQSGTPPCDSATETCDEGGDVCEPIGCQSNAECDDAAFCNGAETCNLGSGQCEPGSPVNVDDGVSCTDDSCDEANDVVVNTANDGLCDNGAFCDGSETCDAVNDCQAGTPPCDSSTETCDETGDICEPIGMLDLDVASLKVTKRVSLTRVKPVGLTLVVKNTGTVEGTALATITGMQNGTEVYNETLTVTDAVGNGRTTYDDDSVPSIPPFVPTVEGDILWKATIADDDPDIDEDTAVTKVVP